MSRKIVILNMLFLILLIGSSNLLADNQPNTELSQIDQLYKDFLASKNPEEITRAINSLDQLIINYPDHYEVFWKAARCYNEYAIFTPNPIKTYERAITYAKRSLELESNNPDAHFWLAVLYGQIGQAKGVLNSLFLVKTMKTELELCLKLNPNYDYAYHILATLYLRVPGWPISIGDKNQALEYELLAVKLNPTYLPYQWNLYQIYNQLGKENAAKQVLQQIIKIPVEYSLGSWYHEPLSPEEIKELANQELHALTD